MTSLKRDGELPQSKKIVVAITGASGVRYGIHLLQSLKENPEIQIDLIVSDGALEVLKYETDNVNENIFDGLYTHRFSNSNLGAKPASGSTKNDGMVVIPCSIKTLSAIASSYADNLITRAASVQLKEERKLILVVRETPLSLPMLENMISVKKAGGTILPASPAFYHKPQTIDDLISTITDRVLDHLQIQSPKTKRWDPDS